MITLLFTTQQGLIDEPTLLDRCGRFLTCLSFVVLSGLVVPVFADDEPDPFGKPAPKADLKKEAAKKAAEKADALKKAKEAGNEPDPFLMNESKGDPDAVELEDAPVDPVEAIQAIAEKMMDVQIDVNVGEIVIGGVIEKKKDDTKKGEPLKHKDEGVQLKISKLLDKMATGERQKRSSFMGVVIEDVALLCGLDEAKVKRLGIAAKGATERAMEGWYQQADRYVQGRMKGATKETADQMLSSIGNVSFGGRDAEKQGEDEALWKESLKTVLSVKQVKDYGKVVAERKLFSEKAFAMVVMATLDEHLRLTPDQHAKLLPLAEASTTEYLDEIRKYWGDYFEKRMLMSLLGGADLKKIKAILTEKQFDRWEAAAGDFDHFWDQRRKEKKAAAAAKKKAEEKVKKKKENEATPKEKGTEKEIEVGGFNDGGGRFFGPVPQF